LRSVEWQFLADVSGQSLGPKRGQIQNCQLLKSHFPAGHFFGKDAVRRRRVLFVLMELDMFFLGFKLGTLQTKIRLIVPSANLFAAILLTVRCILANYSLQSCQLFAAV